MEMWIWISNCHIRHKKSSYYQHEMRPVPSPETTYVWSVRKLRSTHQSQPGRADYIDMGLDAWDTEGVSAMIDRAARQLHSPTQNIG